MPTPNLVFAYFGPETVLPVTSIVATVIGVVMMMGKTSIYWVFSGVKRAVRFCLRRGPETQQPHVTPARSATPEAAETP
jgi:hypothetical protein